MSWEKRVNGLQYLTTGSVSQLAFQTLVWDPWWFTEYRHNTYDPEQVILHGGGKGFLAISENAAKNWEDRTGFLEQTGPPNSWGDDPPPVMNQVIIKQVHGDIHKLGRFCGIAQLATGTATDARGWLLITDNDWFDTTWRGLSNYIQPDTEKTDWILAPNGVHSSSTEASATGVIGSGTIKNDGSEFVLSSVPNTLSGPDNILAIIVEGFRLAEVGDDTLLTNPAGMAGGSLTLVSGLPAPVNYSLTARARANCLNNVGGGTAPQTAGQTVTGQLFIRWGRSDASGGAFSITLKINTPPTDCEEITLLPASPLALDVDNETGLRCYVTAWEDNSLILQNWDVTETSPGLNSKTDLGSATISEVEQRTYYLVPFCPAFFETSGFGDYVYVFGIWPDGAHIKLSTDGGATFGSNLGDASWSANRVAAFFALSTTEFYAFLNVGSQCQIWHTQTGGASWIQRNTLPLNVEHQNVSRHPNGALLIANSQVGVPAAVLINTPPYTEQYIDVTGPSQGQRIPSVPGDGGGGNTSITWVT